MADGDRTIATMSGFGLVKPTTPRPAITFVPAPLVRAGVNAGALEAKVPVVKSAVTYHYFITSNSALPVEEWTRFESRQSKFNFSDLASATRYYIRVAAVGINEQLVFSDVSSYVTQ